MIRNRIKKDLKEAIEKSEVLQGNFLDNIEWLLKTINKDNFEDFPEPLPVGKLRSEVQKAIGAEDDLVYLKPRIYAKIRGWWRRWEGHSEIGDDYFRLLPHVLHQPEKILADKTCADRFLLLFTFEHRTAVVIEVESKAGRNEIVTYFWMREDQPEEHKQIWTATGRTCIPSVLALRSDFGVAGSRFPSLQSTAHSESDTTTNERSCQGGVLFYQKTKLSLDDIHLEHPADPEHGDYSSNVAMKLAKKVGKSPMEVARDVVAQFTARGREMNFANTIERVEVAPPGFINFYLKKEWLQGQVGEILKYDEHGLSEESKRKNGETRVQVEFISANPTGPLHAGNARGGFAGDVLANVLEKVGYNVQREYYINDKGVQVEKYAVSVSPPPEGSEVPEGGYSGDYVKEIAQKAQERGLETFEEKKSFAISEVLENIKKTVVRMGIKFDQFFSEKSLYNSSGRSEDELQGAQRRHNCGDAEKAIEFLRTKKLLYEKEGAVWFKSSKFGDEKDRVLIKSDGEMTYLVSDVAYHLDKFEKRKFDRVILFWGADHHGYIPRFMAMIEAIGHKGKAEVELIQLLKLARGGKVVRMSKRAGEFVTVDEVLDEIGLSAARFHFLAVPLSTPMTLDLEKAKEQSQKNLVYYVQYACARMASILAKDQRSKIKDQSQVQSSKLSHTTELSLIRKLIQLPEVVVDIAKNHEVHRLAQYATEIADVFHRFYENCQVLSEDQDLTVARLGLVQAAQLVLAETLGLMGISAPEKM